MRVSKYDVNMGTLPVWLQAMRSDRTVTFPDMHGNALYMLYCLALCGVFTFTKAQWDDLSCLYSDVEVFKAAHFQEFYDVLEETAVKDPTVCPHVRFIGDTLADRGRHDYLTLLIYERLHRNGFKYSLIYSNHDEEFLRLFKQKDASQFVLNVDRFDVDREQVLTCFNSVVALKDSIDSKEVDLEIVTQMINKAVIPHLRLIEVEKTDDGIVVFTHAPTIRAGLNKLISLLDLPPKENVSSCSVLVLAAWLNKFFMEKQRSDKLTGDQLTLIQWFVGARPGDIQASGMLADDGCCYVHGHDVLTVSGSDKHVSIDGMLGRPGCDAGELKYYMTTPVEPVLSKHAGGVFPLPKPEGAGGQGDDPNPSKKPKI